MSEDVVTKKRNVVIETTTKEKDLGNVNPSLENFDWDEHESDCPTKSRKINKSIKAPQAWNVLSKEPYAQDFVDQIIEHERGTQIEWEVTSGKTYTGKVYSVTPEWATIDINYREMVYIDMTRESAEIKSTIIPGAEVDVQLLKTNNKAEKGYLLGSIGAGIKTALFNELMQSIEENSAYIGLVKEMIPAGGYIVEINGIECFMPGSLAGINKLHDFESIVGTTMYVVPMSFSIKRGTIVVSHREYLKALIPTAINKLNDNLEGIKKGMVTGTTKFGIFVEFNQCLTGMIHINDLTPEYIKKHKSREVKAGDPIEFYVKEVINERKITLSQVETEVKVDPWRDIDQRIKTPAEIQGTVKAVKDYGLFIDIEEGVTGLLHISEIENVIDINTIKSGDPITVQVTRIESATRKVFLKL